MQAPFGESRRFFKKFARGRGDLHKEQAAPHGNRLSGRDGAGNEARTRYLHLGKVALYQMSYARVNKA